MNVMTKAKRQKQGSDESDRNKDATKAMGSDGKRRKATESDERNDKSSEGEIYQLLIVLDHFCL
jgi:hypothetical protein